MPTAPSPARCCVCCWRLRSPLPRNRTSSRPRSSGSRNAPGAIVWRHSCRTCRGSAPRRSFWVFFGDARRLERIGELRGHAADNGKLEGFFNAAIDAALVLQTFVLAAETAGLGCCPISALRNHPDAVAAILGLPNKVFPVAGLCAGYPAAAGYISMRLPLDIVASCLAIRRRKVASPREIQ